jgi:hypothetical protein
MIKTYKHKESGKLLQLKIKNQLTKGLTSEDQTELTRIFMQNSGDIEKVLKEDYELLSERK